MFASSCRLGVESNFKLSIIEIAFQIILSIPILQTGYSFLITSFHSTVNSLRIFVVIVDRTFLECSLRDADTMKGLLRSFPFHFHSCSKLSLVTLIIFTSRGLFSKSSTSLIYFHPLLSPVVHSNRSTTECRFFNPRALCVL